MRWLKFSGVGSNNQEYITVEKRTLFPRKPGDWKHVIAVSHSTTPPHPPLYKGLALFTPGGDLVYGIDPDKKDRWHVQLCAALQDALNLTEPPLFLTPCYTATVDWWLDPQTQELKVSAEVYPRVWQYRVLLNSLFNTKSCPWRMVATPEAICDPLVILSYRQRWPQLWKNHDLLLRVEPSSSQSADLPTPPNGTQLTPINATETETWNPRDIAAPGNSVPSSTPEQSPQGYVLRLFVAGHNSHIVSILEGLHQLLDHALNCPYTLKVIDVIKHPELAEADQVLATPTLVKVWPRPTRYLVGALDKAEKILQLLNAEDSLSEI